MGADTNRVLDALLERLYGSLSRGPALNAQPGNSRQRVDLSTLNRIGGDAQSALAELLGEGRSYQVRFTLTPPARTQLEEEPPEIKRARRDYEDGQKLLRKLAALAKDADTYQRDTGAAVLYIGYPLLSLPEVPSQGRFGSTRILAPLAFIPISLTVSTGGRPGLEITSAASTGSDRVIANVALKTWIERQVGSKYPELFEDEEGEDPFREVSELMNHVAESLQISNPPDLTGWPVDRVPETRALGNQAALIPGAVMGLFPISKQGAIRDMEWLQSMADLPAAIRPFVSLDASLTMASDPAYTQDDGSAVALLAASEEHLIDRADPCQRRAVIRARATRGLVVHGPPGTGKSQTIMNIIGDFLARGKRVLFVCEKRTALDVVKHRLDARGIGSLCAIVHDATSDRAALYTGIRDQLDNMADTAPAVDPSRDLDRVNREIDTVVAELREFYNAMGEKDVESGRSFHELMGMWLAMAQDTALRPVALDAGLATVSSELLRENEGVLRSAYTRLVESNVAENGWDGIHDVRLDDLLSRRMNDLRGKMAAAVSLAREAAAHATPELPPLVPGVDLKEQAAWRQSLGERLKKIAANAPQAVREAACRLAPAALTNAQDSLAGLQAQRQLLESGPLAPDLQQVFAGAPWTPRDVASAIPALGTYLEKGQGFFALFRFGMKKAATQALASLGLGLNRENAEKAKTFLEGVHARNILRAWMAERMPTDWRAEPLDELFLNELNGMGDCIALLKECEPHPAGKDFVPVLRQKLAAEAESLANETLKSAKGAKLAQATIEAMRDVRLFSKQAIEALGGKMGFGKPIDEDLQKLTDDLDRLESLLRFQAEVASFPEAVGSAMKQMARADVEEDAAWCRLLAAVFAGTLDRRLRENPVLLRCDGTRIEGNFARLKELTARKHAMVSASICCLWQTRQRKRLLAATGSRLSSVGAELRRRLMLRGKQASRIRQVIHDGLSIEGGDPLFDIHPVWMTSPETATLILPPEKLFDVVIFDEASQCRLEEGLPVLLRGENIVIAGDTKQLPPTRFFESAVVSSDAGVDDDAGQEGLFQAQQSDIEDLLSASLNIEVEQSYLDVHYRSNNEDLIRFSNESFYGARLQAVPAHPNARAKTPPIELHQVNGLYVNRQNPTEADFIVERVKALLALPNPPSIGIVSFNLTQKDLIEERLDMACNEDAEFRGRLDLARARESDSGYEGLFVKNLENVQGDERDLIIISTTYGPNEDGRFYRRFGPLGRAGGERRLNVIVTRARYRVELVTSIPASVFRADANISVPAGQKPNGAWFLMRYLRDAETLAELYAEANAESQALVDSAERAPAEILQQSTNAPSLFAETFAKLLLEEHGIGSTLYHGNEGFYVDVAFHHPDHPEDVTIGVLFDDTRYSRAQDRVEWDEFKRGILEWQRWELHRVWTPQFLRDPSGTIRSLLNAAERYAASNKWEKNKAEWS